MYKCGLCNTNVAAKMKAQRVVIKTRHRVYSAIKDKNGKVQKILFEGNEIEKEVLACQKCFEQHKQKEICQKTVATKSLAGQKAKLA